MTKNLSDENIFSRKKYYLIFYILFFVGIAGHFSEKYFELMLNLTPFILLLTGFAALIMSGTLRSGKFMIWFITAFLITVIIEIIGVKTGKIFGEYSYGNVLGYKLYDVPLIIGFNWLFVILGAVSISNLLSRNFIAIILLSSLLATLFDYLLEPVAVKLGYWNWAGAVIPFQNYAAWFLITMIATSGLTFFKIKASSVVFIHYFIAQTIFFLALNFK